MIVDKHLKGAFGRGLLKVSRQLLSEIKQPFAFVTYFPSHKAFMTVAISSISSPESR